ncbi:MAG: hypothetical protein MJ198_06715 [Bacteroidales bacterium]|nr:hypothetical protein [Bacteroidales bacterium]
MRRLKSKTIAVLLCSCMFLQGCENAALNELLINILVSAASGWLADSEDMDSIPEDIVIVDPDESELKSSVDLSSKFPPIGDQGSYGTCVAWASGYNLKTALDAIDKGWTTSQLSSKSYQTSPADLWAAIPSSSRGSGCNGTNFDPALTALISTGAASLETVPYTKINCSSTSAKGNSSNKLANYRKICDGSEGMTVNNFKFYLNQGRPVVIGARLGDNFMSWNSSAVIKSDTYLQEGMQHAYHAMVLSGYDDKKNAFRVRNSWGSSWGDNGSIWVDYDFFLKSFVFAAFVAQNTTSVSVAGSSIASTDLTSGYDLMAYSANDYDYDDEDDEDSSDPNWRVMEYRVFNSGTKEISANKNWKVYFCYYNAYKAKDYEIIYEDYYTKDYGDNEDHYDILPEEETVATSGGYWNNIDIPSGEEVGEGTKIIYYMPEITGKYYLTIIVDAEDVIAEGNEENNFYYITTKDGKPLDFVNGVVQNEMKVSSLKALKVPQKFGNTENQTPVCKGNVNAYTPAEISRMLLHDKESGKLNEKIQEYRLKSAVKPNAKKVVKR